MNILNRVLKTIQKNKIKYVILFFLIIILNISLFVSLKIFQYSLTEIENINMQYGTYVTIEKNPRYVKGNVDVEDLTYQDYKIIATSEYVQSANYEQTINLSSNEINITSNFSLPTDWLNHYIPITGTDLLEKNSNYNIKLTKGSFPQNNYEIIVNTDMLEDNDWHLNQIINLKYNDISYDFKIVGTYEYINNYPNTADTIYTTYDTTYQITGDRENIKAIFHLYSYKDAEAFEEQLYENGLSELFYINSNELSINQKTAPYINEINLMTNIRNLLTIAIVIIILIISSFIFNSKKNNIKILRMLGVSKIKLLILSLLEVLIVTVFSLFFVTIFIIIIDNLLLSSITINYLQYIYIIRNIFVTNLVILFLVNFEAILFINSYDVEDIIDEEL